MYVVYVDNGQRSHKVFCTTVDCKISIKKFETVHV